MVNLVDEVVFAVKSDCAGAGVQRSGGVFFEFLVFEERNAQYLKVLREFQVGAAVELAGAF